MCRTARAARPGPPPTCVACRRAWRRLVEPDLRSLPDRLPFLIDSTKALHGHSLPRLHHARRHRTDGHEPAPDPLDRRDPRRGRRGAVEWRPRMPDPILIGRNAAKIEALAKAHGIARWGTNLDAALAEQGRHGLLRRGHHGDAAEAAGARRSRPASMSTARSRSPPTSRRARDGAPGEAAGREARRGAGQAVSAGPAEARMLDDAGFFGRMLSVRGEFGYWVFEGDCSRSSGLRGTTAPRTAAASSWT